MTDCKYGDPHCPCPDGDPCHYEGDDPMSVPPEYVRQIIDIQHSAISKAAKAEREECARLAAAFTVREGASIYPGVPFKAMTEAARFAAHTTARQIAGEIRDRK